MAPSLALGSRPRRGKSASLKAFVGAGGGSAPGRRLFGSLGDSRWRRRGTTRGGKWDAGQGHSASPATVLVVDSDARALRLLEVGCGKPAIASTPRCPVMMRWRRPRSRRRVWRSSTLSSTMSTALAFRLGCARCRAASALLLLLFVVDPRRPSDRLRAFEGAGDVLERPVHLKEALWRVETLLEKRRSAAS